MSEFLNNVFMFIRDGFSLIGMATVFFIFVTGLDEFRRRSHENNKKLP